MLTRLSIAKSTKHVKFCFSTCSSKRKMGVMSGDEVDLTKLDFEQLQRLSGKLLGKKYGSKGGKIRAKNLTAKRRSEIARKAAAARWANKEQQN